MSNCKCMNCVTTRKYGGYMTCLNKEPLKYPPSPPPPKRYVTEGDIKEDIDQARLVYALVGVVCILIGIVIGLGIS